MRLYDNELEYLEVSEASNGAPYIDTGFIPTEYNNVFSIDFMPTFMSENANDFWFGNYEYLKDSVFCRQSREASVAVCCAGRGASVTRIDNVGLNVKHSLLLTDSKTTYGSRYNMDGRNGDISNILVGERTDKSLYIFKGNGTGEPCMGRLYSFRINKGASTLLDLIPVRKDGVGYMYDKVSGKLFGNAGTGKFLLGPDVVTYQGRKMLRTTQENITQNMELGGSEK